MRGLFTSLFLIFSTCFVIGQSDLIITAAYDGPLTGGVPKGLELFAMEDIPDLSIYGIGIANNGGGSDGKEYDFPADAITAGTYIYWTLEDAGFELFFGFTPEYVDPLANINGDDALELYKDGVVVDVFGDVELDGTGLPWEYMDGWAVRNPGTGPDGADFVLGHWRFSGINAFDNASDNATASKPLPLKSYDQPFTGDATIVGTNTVWTPANITIEAGQTVQFQNGGGFHNVNGTIDTYPTNPEGFTNGDPSSDPWVYNFTFNLEGTYEFQCDPHAAQNMLGMITVNAPAGPGYPAYDIATISTIDGTGLPDSIGVTTTVTGLVYGIDYAGSGSSASFFLIDATGGVAITTPGNLSYTVVEGEELSIEGTVTQSNGLTRVDADDLTILSEGNPLASPTVVTELNETTESEFIRINDLTLVDANEWPGDGSSFTAMATDGSNMFAIRVDSDSEVANRPAPPESFDIIGLGAQFDTSSPYDEGYQITPRYNTDVIQDGAAPLAGDDVLNLAINENGSVNVVLNDFIPGEFDAITLIGAAPTFGMATVSDSTINYFPFQDECGEDILEYEICDTDGLCDTAMVVVTVACPPSYPEYAISVVTTNDANGVSDSIGMSCALRGIVYGVNLRPPGLLFTIIDKDNPEDGIAVFSDEVDFGYVVTEGDEVLVQGVISQFFGLTQINIEGISVLSSGNALHDPFGWAGMLEESLESRLIRIPNLTIVDPMEWDNMGSGFTVTVTDGNDEYAMRIDADTDIFNTPVPTMGFNLTGIGGQFDNAEPYDEGYQISPRRLSDIDFGSAIEEIENFENRISIFPNPTADWATIHTDMDWEKIFVFSAEGKLTKVFNENQNSIFVGDLSNGQYTLIFQSASEMGAKKIQVIR